MTTRPNSQADIYLHSVNPADHFVLFHDMITIGSDAERQVDNIKMSLYACYLSVQNADTSKLIVAQA